MPCPALDRLRAPLARLGAHVPPSVRDAARRCPPAAPRRRRRRVVDRGPPAVGSARRRPERRRRPAATSAGGPATRSSATAHIESADVPAVRIDRPRPVPPVVLHCSRHPTRPARGVLETSPRLGDEYRDVHADVVRLPGQRLRPQRARRRHPDSTCRRSTCPTPSLDVVLTPHVLEHVPDTAKALARAAPGDRSRRADVPPGAGAPRRRPRCRPSRSSTPTTRRCSSTSAGTSPISCGRPASTSTSW